MYLIKSKNSGVHGIDYTKGLEDGRLCGKVHEFMTLYCRPLLLTKEEAQKNWKFDEVVNYDELSDQEKLLLGEPIFWGSSLHNALKGIKTRRVLEEVEIDTYGQKINRKVEVENCSNTSQ